MDTQFDALNARPAPRTGCRSVVLAPPRHAQQLDAKAQLLRTGHVQALQRRDAFHLGIGKPHRHSERIGREQRELVRGVDAFYVEGRIRLRITERLGLGQRLGKAHAFTLHLAQDEIGGAVHDSRQPFNAVGREALAQRLHDGDADGHRAFVRHGHAVLACGRKDLVAMFGQQGLVGRYDMLARANGGQYPFARRAGAACGLDQHIHLGVRSNLHGIVGQRHVFAHHARSARQVAGADHDHLNAPPRAAGDQRLVARQHAEGARTHSAHADHPYPQGAHRHSGGVRRLMGR